MASFGVALASQPCCKWACPGVMGYAGAREGKPIDLSAVRKAAKEGAGSEQNYRLPVKMIN